MIRHETIRIPKDIVKETVITTILGIISSFGFDMLAFFLQLGKDQIAEGNIILGLVFIAIYYMQRTLDTSISLWMDDIHTTYREHYTTAITNIVVQILLKVRGKVWRINTETNSKEKMSTNALLLSSKNYISYVWDFIKNSLLFITIIVVVSIFSVLFSNYE